MHIKMQVMSLTITILVMLDTFDEQYKIVITKIPRPMEGLLIKYLRQAH